MFTKFFILISTLFIATTSMAAYSPGVFGFNAGGASNSSFPSATLPFNTQTFELSADIVSSTADHYAPLAKEIDTQGSSNISYVVPASTVTTCIGSNITSNTASGFVFGSATAAVTVDSASVTSGVCLSSAACSSNFTYNIHPTQNALDGIWTPQIMHFTAGRFPFVKYNTGSASFHVRVICQEHAP